MVTSHARPHDVQTSSPKSIQETSDFDHLRLLGEVSQLVGKNCLAGMNLSVHFIAMFSTARGNWTEEILPFILPDFNISDEAVSIIDTR